MDEKPFLVQQTLFRWGKTILTELSPLKVYPFSLKGMDPGILGRGVQFAKWDGVDLAILSAFSKNSPLKMK